MVSNYSDYLFYIFVFRTSTKKGLSYLDTDANALLLLRQLTTMKKKTHLAKRPFILADNAELVDVKGGIGTLKVTGYVRGPPLNVNKLVHIQGWGDFQISKIVDGRDPRSLRPRKVSITLISNKLSFRLPKWVMPTWLLFRIQV